jgi:hypothetical protein
MRSKGVAAATGRRRALEIPAAAEHGRRTSLKDLFRPELGFKGERPASRLAAGIRAAFTSSSSEAELEKPPVNQVRRWCWLLDHSTAWTFFVNLAVVTNTFILMIDAPYAWYAADVPGLAGLSATAEIYFTVAFTIEMCVRVVALGPVRYLRSVWGWLDVLVVALGWAEFIMAQSAQDGSSGNFSVIRSFRILRAMRATRTLPQLQHIIQCLFIAVLDLGNVVLLLGMVFLIFGLVGIILFGNKLHFQCMDDRSGLVLDGEQRCSADPTSGYQCVQGASCIDVYDNPNNNLTSFDNIVYAFLTIFQCVTGEGWADVMYLVMDTVSEASSVYFVALTVFATWFCINLLVAVLSEAYTSVAEEAEVKRETQCLEEERLRREVAARLTGTSKMRSLIRRTRMSQDFIARASGKSVSDEGEPSERKVTMASLWHALTMDPRLEKAEEGTRLEAGSLEERIRARREKLNRVVMSMGFRVPIVLLILVSVVTLMIDNPYLPAGDKATLLAVNQALSIAFLVELLVKLLALGPRQYWKRPLNRVDFCIVVIALADLIVTQSGSTQGISQVSPRPRPRPRPRPSLRPRPNPRSRPRPNPHLRLPPLRYHRLADDDGGALHASAAHL